MRNNSSWVLFLRFLASGAILFGIGGCANSSAQVSSTTVASTAPTYIQAEHAETAFETRFRAEYMAGKNQGYLRSSTVRFRTPCHSEGSGRWTCEGWGMEAMAGSENCVLVTATATASGVEGELHAETESPQQEGFNVCREGTKEGQPLGNLNAEGGTE